MNPTTKATAAARPESTLKLSLPIAVDFRVDREKGELANLALITGDREARGHGLYIDGATLHTGEESVRARGGRLKAALRHPTMADWWSRNQDRITDLPGFFSGISVRGNQLVAEKVEFFESFKTTHKAEFAHLLEMAEKTPELFGLSIECYGFAVYVGEDGTEFSEKPADVPLKYAGIPALRITDLSAAAFVDEPAANDGVFATFARRFGLDGLFGRERAQLTQLRSLANAFLAWSETPAAQTAFTCAASDVTPRDEPTALAAQDDMKILLALKEKFGADKALHQRALALLSDDATLTVDQIEAKLNEKPPAAEVAAEPSNTLSLADVTARFGADKPRLARAFAILSEKPESTLEQIDAELAKQDSAELTRLRAENEKLQKRLNSGHAAALHLGAAGGHGGAAATKPELFGLNRVTAAFAADPRNPANAVARN